MSQRDPQPPSLASLALPLGRVRAGIARTRRLAPVVALFVALCAPAAAASPPRVVASIPPIHSLVAAVMAGVGAPTLLVRGGASPHGYAMAPSDAAAIQEADALFWVGPQLETFLGRPLASRRDLRLVTLIELPGLTLHATREGGVFDGHGHREASEGASVEPHIWLDPHNAKAIVAAAVRTLGDIDPANAGTYAANGGRLAARLDALDRELAAVLAPVQEIPFVVFHDAYQYIERRYDLAVAAAITVAPDRMPGARRLREVQDRIRAAGAACVFAEPQFEPDVIRTVIEGTSARVGTLDPLGTALEPGRDLYFAMMHALAGSLLRCLAAQ